MIKYDCLGVFTGFVLMNEFSWDRERVLKNLRDDWGIVPDSSEVDPLELGGEPDEVIFGDAEGFRIAMRFIPEPCEHAANYAGRNYMWEGAEEAVKDHKAALALVVLGNGSGLNDKARFFVKCVCAALKQEGAAAFYRGAAVWEPKFFLDSAELMREGAFPVMNVLWFGIRLDDNDGEVYTAGMNNFGYPDIEVISPRGSLDLEKLRLIAVNTAAFVLDKGVELADGQVIEILDRKIPVSIDKGIALGRDTVKIRYI